MTVSAQSARRLAEPANVARVELRRGGPVLAGSYLYEGDLLVTGWHVHDVHQIEYAIGGVVEVETAAGHYLLPPQQAAWIPAGLQHQATMNPSVKTLAVMFDPAVIPDGGDRARILAVSPLLREMLLYALRWPIDRGAGAAEEGRVSDSFFLTLANLVSDALDHEAPLSLPTSEDPVVAAAMAYTKDHLQSVSLDEVCRAVAVSERTLRRQFQSEVGCPGARTCCMPGCCGPWRCSPPPVRASSRPPAPSASTAWVRSPGRSPSSAARRRRHTGDESTRSPSEVEARRAALSCQRSRRISRPRCASNPIDSGSRNRRSRC